MPAGRSATSPLHRALGSLRSAAARLLGSLRKRPLDARLDEELRFHLDMQERDNLARGMSREEARRAALRSFGAVEPLKEQYRTRRGVPFLDTFAQDLRYALRMLRKSPGFTAVALLSLAFGIGANVAIFSVVDALLLKPLPVRGAERLMVLQKRDASGDKLGLFSYSAFRRLSEPASRAVCSAIIAATAEVTAVVRPEGERPAAAGDLQDNATDELVSGNFFSALGVAPAAGRTFTAEEAAEEAVPGAHPVAVISYGYWQRRFGRDPRVVGRVLRINGSPVTVVGVAPRGFVGVTADEAPDLFLPLSLRDAVRYRGDIYADGPTNPDAPPWQQVSLHWLQLLAQRRPGVGPAQAGAVLGVLLRREVQAEAAVLADAEERRYVQGLTLALEPGARGLANTRERLGNPLLILLGTSALVLLIACANLANLLLARADSRRREMAVRLGIGAARGRLVRQLLTESLLLAGLGSALGLLLAYWGSRFLLTLVGSGDAPLPLDVALDGRKLAFAAAAALATGIAFGLAPALQATRVDLTASLKAGSKALAGDPLGKRRGLRLPLGRLLVAAQIALSLVLLVGAGLFARSLRNLMDVDTGFERGRLVTATVEPRLRGYDQAHLATLYDRLLGRLAALPGARSASLSLHPLMSNSGRSSTLSLPGYTPRQGEDMNVRLTLVTPSFFATVGMPVVAGRSLGPGDRAGAPLVAVINETFARRFFPRGSALGRRFGFSDHADRGDYEVVGVVRDAKYNRLGEPTKRMAFFPVAQQMEALHSVEVRLDSAVTAPFAGVLRRAIAEVDPDLPVLGVASMSERLERSLSRERAVARLTGFFAVLALLLASVGLYGVLSYNVARRSGEIGLRLALGAPRRRVLTLILRDTAQLIAIGAGTGVLAALATTRVAASQLFGITARDPLTIAIATLALVAVALLAGFLPARRAAGTDPMVALRGD
jgi:predicted permease